MLDIKPKKQPNKVRGFRMSDDSWNILTDMSLAYGVTRAKVIEAMLTQYGSKVLKELSRQEEVKL
jgi:hypothetical protein